MLVAFLSLTSALPAATRSSIVAGQSGARSVLRISAMFSTEYGTPYSWPPKVMPLTASGSNIDVSGIVTGSMALFWTKSADGVMRPDDDVRARALPGWRS